MSCESRKGKKGINSDTPQMEMEQLWGGVSTSISKEPLLFHHSKHGHECTVSMLRH